MRTLLTILHFGIFALSLSGVESITIFENGKSQAEIVTGKSPSAVVRFAAKELAAYLNQSGKCRIPVKTESSAPIQILLGKPAADLSGIKAERDQSHVMIRPDGKILIFGLDDPSLKNKEIHELLHLTRDKGTLEGVYGFLEKYAGIRWTCPGADGEHVPQPSKLSVPVENETIIPAFIDRRLYHFDGMGGISFPDQDEYGGYPGLWLWALRMRSGSWMVPVYGCHTAGKIGIANAFAKTHPEWFALQPDGTRNTKFLCWSNPEVIRFWTDLAKEFFSGKSETFQLVPGGQKRLWSQYQYLNRDEFLIDMYDTYQRYACQCESCQKFIREHENGLSELLWRAVFQISDGVSKEYPGKLITALAYTPKQKIPVATGIPKNLLVRLAIPGPDQAIGSREGYAAQLNLLKGWSQALGKKIPLWIYIISARPFGLHGIPLSNLHAYQQYLRDIRPYCSGMFNEDSTPNHTISNLECYVRFKLLWNPEIDVDKTIDEYCALHYGPAAGTMRQFHDRLENNWTRVLKTLWPKDTETHPWNPRNIDRIAGEAFRKIYTPEEISVLEKLLEKATSQVPPGTPYSKNISRDERWILELIKNERSSLLEDNSAYRRKTVLFTGLLNGAPSEADWAKTPWIGMVTADGKKTIQESRFKMLADRNNFYFRGEFADSNISGSKTLPRKDGNLDGVGTDNEIELFFYSNETGKPVQILVNDLGWTAVVRGFTEGKSVFTTHDPVVAKVSRTASGWTADVTIPNSVTNISKRSGDIRFNVIRARNVKDTPCEYSTWSPEADFPKWSNPRYYGRMKFVQLPTGANPIYEGQSLAPKGTVASTYPVPLPNKTSSWYNWTAKGSNAKLSFRPEKGLKGVLESDFSHCDPEGKAPGGSWNFPFRCTPGARLRVSARGMIQTSRPDAGLRLSVRWQDARRKPVEWDKLGAGVVKKITSGEWTDISMDVVVPEGKNIEYLILGCGSENAWPGIVQYEQVKISEVR